jgi:hypothetical protein
MSWNTQLLVVPGAGMADLAPAGLAPHGAKIGADLAIEQDFLSAVEHNAALILVGNVIDPDLCGRLAASLQREVVSAMFAGVSDTYMWQVCSPGADRFWAVQTGETVEDVGTPAPAEQGVESLDEDSLFRLLHSYTGGELDLTELEAQPVRYASAGPEAGSDESSDTGRPNLFRRLFRRD